MITILSGFRFEDTGLGLRGGDVGAAEGSKSARKDRRSPKASPVPVLRSAFGNGRLEEPSPRPSPIRWEREVGRGAGRAQGSDARRRSVATSGLNDYNPFRISVSGYGKGSRSHRSTGGIGSSWFAAQWLPSGWPGC